MPESRVEARPAVVVTKPRTTTLFVLNVNAGVFFTILYASCARSLSYLTHKVSIRLL